MDLFLFRLSLKTKEAPDLFEPRGPQGEELSREGWLRLYFAAPHTFNHRGSQFYFSPEQGFQRSLEGLIVGWIGRERVSYERTPPEEGFVQIERPQWLAAFFAMDPSPHSDGQKIAIEHNNEIGRPSALLSSLVRHMNEHGDGPFSAQAFPIISEGSFWDFAATHGDSIKSLTFDVAAPNMFNDAEDFQKELRALRDGVNMAQFKATLESDSVLKHRSPRIEEIVNYTERGGGALSAEASDGATYHSETHEAREHVDDIEHHSKNLDRFFADIRLVLSRIFR
jgi:hypothetical protein